jgi:hypothetical protein
VDGRAIISPMRKFSGITAILFSVLNFPLGAQDPQGLPAINSSGQPKEAVGNERSGLSEAVPTEGNQGKSDEQGEWITVDIPQIKGSIKIPKGWHKPSAEQALQATGFINFSSDDDRATAEMAALSIGRMSILVTQNPEPTESPNPSVIIGWGPTPLVFEQMPLEARSEGLSRFLSAVVLPALKSKDQGFQLLEGPKAIDDEGSGAWVTFRSSTRLKSGGTNEAIVRLYTLPARDHIITVQITTPVDREKSEEVLHDLWAIFESLSYAK